jgi:tetratricopeptide (TPR) repeat protein
VCQQAQDFQRFVKWSREYLALDGANTTVRPVYIQTLAVLKMHKEVVEEINIKMKLDLAAQLKTPENELRMLAISQRQLKDEEGYNETLKRLLLGYPSKAYWSEMIARLARQASFNGRYDLDLYRLLELTGNMEEANEFIDMANIALKNGLPAEAARVMAQAEALGVLGKGPDALTHQKLKLEVKQKLAEDEKALPGLERSAKDANTIASLAEVYAAKQQWETAIVSFNKAMALGGLRREAEVKLHTAWAHYKAGKKTEAVQLWDSIKDDTTAVSLAQLFKIWAINN